MKRYYLYIFLAFVCCSGTLFAQNIKQPRYSVNLSDTMVNEGMVTNAPNPARVHIRAARDFERRFRGRSATWQQSNDTVVARFTADSVTTFAGYGKSGNWLYTIRFFSEWQIPRNIRHEVRSMFYDYQINIVYEMVFPDKINKAYLIYLTDSNKNQKVILWSDSEIKIVQGSTHKKPYYPF